MFTGAFSSPNIKITRNRPGDWWNLYGVIPKANCIAAYRAKGAASQAASYVNLVTPGTYDAAPGTAPGWNATDGWVFDTDAKNLTTGVVPSSTWTGIIRYTNSTVDYAECHLWTGTFTTPSFDIGGRYSSTQVIIRWGSGSKVSTVTGSDAGVLAMAGKTGYFNGSSIGDSLGTWSGTAGAMCFKTNRTSSRYYLQAAAIYNTTLSAEQISALTTAINAL